MPGFSGVERDSQSVNVDQLWRPSYEYLRPEPPHGVGMDWGAEHWRPVFWPGNANSNREPGRSRLEESHLRDGTCCPYGNLPEPPKKRGMRAYEPLVMGVLAECWIEGRGLESVEEGEVEHGQARDREYDSGYDETLSRARARESAFIDTRVYGDSTPCSTTARESDSSHVTRELRHPT